MKYNKKQTTAVYRVEDVTRSDGRGSVLYPVWCGLVRFHGWPGPRCFRIDYIWRALGPNGYLWTKYSEPVAGVEPVFTMNSDIPAYVQMHAAFCCKCAMKSGYNVSVMARARQAVAVTLAPPLARGAGKRRRYHNKQKGTAV